MDLTMISAIGVSVVDHIIVIDGFKGSEGSFYCENYHVEGGGMAATALCTASRLGSRTRLFSRIGDDINGQFILDELEKFDIDTSGVITLSGKNSFVSIILVNSKTGEKQFFSERNQPVIEDNIVFNPSQLNGTDVLLLDGFWMEAALEGALWSSQNGIPVVGDFKERFPGLENILPHINYLIIPEFFASEITGKNDVMAMLRSLRSMISGIPVVTKGSDGGAYLIEDEIRYYRTFPVQCIDSTGAGDAFHGAFCHFLAEGLSIDRCLELASAVGAMNCLAIGGRSSLPTMDELSVFLETHGYDSGLHFK